MPDMYVTDQAEFGGSTVSDTAEVFLLAGSSHVASHESATSVKRVTRWEFGPEQLYLCMFFFFFFAFLGRMAL
jgi:hypothetical protein